MRILLMSLIFGWVFSCQEGEKETKTPLASPIQQTKPLRAAFLVVDGVYNSELIAPMDVFQHTRFHTSNAIEVFTIAPKRDTITTFEGLKLIPDYGFEDHYPAIDILVVPSAEHSMDTDLENETLLTFVALSGKQALYTLSLCDGAFVLAEAKLLDTYECTTFPGDIAKFKRAYPKLKVHENVSFVHDRRAITSAGGAKSYDAALYMVELLYGKEVADGIAKGLVIEWNVSQVKHIQT
ncbi:MAG: glutamine amidotransferase, partial [Cyclobacteriaceae bacterium]|nr:glutamine amidotransferase [Cyclobacteriaceae bacterium]